MLAELDALVIGAGVTGLAAAAQLAAEGRSVCVAERHTRPGLDTSTHNSGVIHAGIYYPATLKARLCVEGARADVRVRHHDGVPHDRCGKLVVATSEQEIAAIDQLQQRGRERRRRVRDGRHRFIRTREPSVVAHAALWSPASGRIDARRSSAPC